MRLFLRLMLCIFVSLVACSPNWATAAVTYKLTPQSAGGATLTGWFTTDGVIGPLAPNNVIAASITITQGSNVYSVGLPDFPNMTPFTNVSATATEVDIAPATGALSWCPNPPQCRPGFYIDETQTVYLYGLDGAPIGVGPA